jgi:hypothetical protein
MSGLPDNHEYRRISGFGYVPDSPKGSATKKSGEAKVRPEALQNKVDKKSLRTKVFNAPISSATTRKKSKSSSPTGGKVAALLKTKDTNNNKDSGDKLG